VTGLTNYVAKFNSTTTITTGSIVNLDNGNVGIGTTVPNFKFEIGAGSSNVVVAKLTQGYERVRYYGFDLLGYNDGNLWMIGNNATNGLILGSNWDWDAQAGIYYTPGTYGAAGGSLEIGQLTKNNANFTHGNTRFYTNGVERVRIISTGNVGIGTTTPGAPLTIYKASNPWIHLNGGGSFSYIRFDDGTSNAYLLKNTTSDTTNGALAGALYTYTDSNKAFQHIHNGTPLFTILSGGNVGIGSTAPANKLQVVGDIGFSGGTSTRMLVSYTNLTDNEDWSNSPISIRERDLVGNAQSADKYGPNINFHWANRVSNSLWMNLNGILNWGDYSASGIPAADGIFRLASLQASANIGIGTTAPGALLNIRASAPTGTGTVTTGTNLLIDSNTSNYITFRNTADNGTYAGLTFLDNNTGGYIVFRNYTGDVVAGSDSMIYGTYQDHIFQNGSSETINGKTETMRIKGNGNVGIGTTSPGAKFVVNNNGGTGNAFYVDVGNRNDVTTLFEHTGTTTPVPFRLRKSGYSGTAANYGLLYLHMNDGTVGNGSNLYFTLNDSAGNEHEYGGLGAHVITNTNGAESGDLVFYTSDAGTVRSEKVRIKFNGNVGIGTTSPNGRLTIVGDGSQNTFSSVLRVSDTSTIGKWAGIGFPDVQSTTSSANNYYFIGRGGAYTDRVLSVHIPNAADYGSGVQPKFGIYSTGADLLFSVEASTGTSYFKGNVGIGTAGPSSLLNVHGANPFVRINNTSTSDHGIKISYNNSDTHGLHLFYNANIATSYIDNTYPTSSGQVFGDIYFRQNVAGTMTTRMTIKADGGGNVGIGTTSPAFKLDVNGAIGVGGLRFLDLSTNYFRIFEPAGNIAIYLGNAGDPSNYFDNTNHVFRNRGGSSVYALINSNGNLGIGTTSVTDKLSIVNGNISLSDSYKLYNGSSNDSVGIYFSNTLQANIAGYNGIIFRSSATNISSQTERMRITNGGNVGIGTTSPSASLHVNSTTAGATLLRTDGTSGTLFSVVDDLSDSLMSVNNSAGLPVLEVFADDRIVAGQYGQNDFVVVNNKVGIGTNNPVAKLQVTSSTSIPSAIFMGGNVGIGTTNPVGKLDVRAGSGGEIIFGSYDANYTVRVQSGDQLNFYNGASAGAAYINYAGGATVLSQNLHVEKATGGTTGLVRIKADGNLGIGTTFPTAKVDTLGVRIGRDFSIANRATVRLDSNGTSYPSDVLFGHTAVANETSWTGIYWSLSSRAAADSNRFYFYRGSGNPAPNNSEAIIMTFDPNLNVGIGTTVPSALLDVSGSLKCAGKFVQNSTTQSITGTNQTLTLNVAAAAVHIVSMTSGATITTISYSNRDNNPSVNTLMLVVKYAGTASITFTSVIWANGVAPTLTATNGFADVFMLTSYQGGAGTPVWIGTVVAQALVSTNL
jgi:hypothetical protein